MEQLRENLLKNEWVRDSGIPSLTHGELALTSTSYLDKWLADFESKTLNPRYMTMLTLFDTLLEKQDVLESFLLNSAKFSLMKRLNSTKIRISRDKETLLKLGWFETSDEPTTFDRDLTSVSKFDKMTNLDRWFKNYEDRRNQNIQVKEPATSAINKDVEKLLDMLSSKKISLPAKTSQVIVDKWQLKKSLKSRHHEVAINRLGQGWSVTKKSRNQITVVKVAESKNLKNGASTSCKLVIKDTSRKTDRLAKCDTRQGRRDKFEAQNKSNITSPYQSTSLEQKAPVSGKAVY
ncbi:hypothetical protein LOTGIDRAFT_153320 [Lottia gigantea]|uniref:Uncharacterized protein n=1 Tax=Lottia gigantea TaxID=225164 RepID=V3ZR30_LOTGI|nr:hypothetical protein LOTGIDRAFT_153320 [Lottia gigantea]ESO93848.1 hypothetical protein LOTGIDRAFT_153320 [Lottia gigantea]